MTIQWAVVFNQCRLEGTLPSDLCSELVLDESDMDRVEHVLQHRVYDYFWDQAFDRVRENRPGWYRRLRSRDADLNQVAKEIGNRYMRVSDTGWRYLRSRFLADELRVKPPRLSTRIKKEAAKMSLLTDEQYHVIETLESKEYLWAKVRGCSGSGKTLCAIELARRFAKGKQKVLLLCFNPALRYWLAREIKPHKEWVKVSTIHAYCRDNIADLPSSAHLPAREKTLILDYEWPVRLQEHLEHDGMHYDVIIVDEAQDYKGMWWDVIPLLLKGDQSRLYAFYDENQVLYDDSALEGIPIQDRPLVLRRNCRNTQKIHDFISVFYHEPEEIICQGPEGELPRFFVYGTDTEQKDGVRRLLARWSDGLADVTQPFSNVVLLTLHGRTDTFLRDTPELGNVHLVERPTSLSRARKAAREPFTVLWSTDRRFKGLESDAIFLVDIDQQQDAAFVNQLLYVGGSRARHRLYGFVHKDSLGWLRDRVGGRAEFFEDISVLAGLDL